jgi:hypothetical protein
MARLHGRNQREQKEKRVNFLMGKPNVTVTHVRQLGAKKINLKGTQWTPERGLHQSDLWQGQLAVPVDGRVSLVAECSVQGHSLSLIRTEVLPATTILHRERNCCHCNFLDCIIYDLACLVVCISVGCSGRKKATFRNTKGGRQSWNALEICRTNLKWLSTSNGFCSPVMALSNSICLYAISDFRREADENSAVLGS